MSRSREKFMASSRYYRGEPGGDNRAVVRRKAHPEQTGAHAHAPASFYPDKQPAVSLRGNDIRLPDARAVKPADVSGGPIRRKATEGAHCTCGGGSNEEAGGCAACQAQQTTVQRSADAGGTEQLAIPPVVHETLSAPGQPLDPTTRAFMEPRFGKDFGRLRVHNDAQAAASARAIDARAYTVGRHLVFGAGQYAPHAADGKRLLAHELAHVVQQGDGGTPSVQRRLSLGSASDAHEHEADRVADQVVASGAPAPVSLTPVSGLVQRACFHPPLPRATACTGVSGDSVGETFLFVRACDDLRTDTGRRGLPGAGTGDEAALRAFASTLSNGDTVSIHGFASEEGDLVYNESLSCLRAQSALRVIMRETRSRGFGVHFRLFMHGEVTGRPLADRRKVVISVARAAPRPTTPTPCVPAVYTGRTPVLIYYHGSVGTGRDAIWGDFPTSIVSGLPWYQRWPVNLIMGSPDIKLLSVMAGVLGGLGGAEGVAAVRQFNLGAGGAITYWPGSPFSTLASSAVMFRAAVAAAASRINAAIRAQAAACNIDYRTIRLPSGAIPAIAFLASDSVPLKAVIGGTQALWVSISSFSSFPGRTYTAVLSFDIYDDFGVDESDLYAPGLYEFYVLQHFRTAYRPFVHRIVVEETITGSY